MDEARIANKEATSLPQHLRRVDRDLFPATMDDPREALAQELQ